MTLRTAELNGLPGIVIDGPAGPISAATIDIDDAGRVGAIHLVANPDKLRALAAGRELPL
jgi:RNA polymerase sigma-70 factor (ECF subfamily)